MSGQSVTVRKLLPATCEEVFDAWLDADGMRAWMCPGPITTCDVKLEPRVGGNFNITMYSPQLEVTNNGVFRILERPTKLQFTWTSTHMGHEETLITIELHQRDEQCELILTHERLPVGHAMDELHGGWEAILTKLGRYLKA